MRAALSLAMVLVGGTAAAQAPLAPGRAEGTLLLNDHTTTLAAAYGRHTDRGTEVALVDKAIPDALLDPEVRLEDVMGRAGASGVLFMLLPEGARAWQVSTGRGGGGCGAECDSSLRFEPSTSTAEAVSGRILTRASVQIGGQPLQVSARFHARVRRYEEPRPTAGQEPHRQKLREAGYAFDRAGFFTAAVNNPRLLAHFVHAGMPVDARHPRTGETLLMATLLALEDCEDEAARDVIGTLIALGASGAETIESNGLQTALTVADPCIEHMGRLLTAGARLDEPAGHSWPQRSTSGHVLMERALEDGDATVADWLISNGYDVKPKGAELLKKAAGKPELVKLLKAAGAKAAAPAPGQRRPS